MPFNSIFSWLIKKRIHQIDLFKKYPIEVQQELFQKLLKDGAYTAWGEQHRFKEIKDYQQFRNQVPLQDYDTLKPYIEEVMKGKHSVLWPNETKWFAKSSGTTSDRSKLIPVTEESLEDCHYKGGKDLLSMYYMNFPNRKLYKGKHLIIGGSTQLNPLTDNSYFGDLSAIIVNNLPWWAEIRRTPSKEIALMSDWEEKLEKMAWSTIDQDVYILAGVPSWTLVLAKRILEITGKKNLKEVWPNLELFMHGGVHFEPYRAEFEKLIPDPTMNYVETYNASEGFFGIQDDPNSDDMLLMLDYGIFYEFIPMDSFEGLQSKLVIGLDEVQIGVNYALVISTNGGLWRYILGDTIRFTSCAPYKFKVTGRTKSFINAFGEELVVENAEQAIAYASFKTDAQINEFTAGPIYMDSIDQGGHEWLIEFHKDPNDFERFCLLLDEKLRSLNSDYDAKRYRDFVLKKPSINRLPKGTFAAWMKANQKLGGQHKIPRLANNRQYLDQILSLNQMKTFTS